MDFHSLKRRELQALCKKHKIAANLTNLEMAEKLTALLTVNEKPLTRGPRSCLKVLDENVSENESDVENRPAKKVRFSPENEMIEFEKSELRNLEMRGRGRRKSVMFKDKGSGGVAATRNHGVNEKVRELRRSRRGKLLEVSEVESKGGKRDKKVDNSRDNSIADDMVAGEATTTRNHGVNEEVRELRRSRRGELLEDSAVESKGGKRDKRVDTSRDNSIVDDMVNGEVATTRNHGVNEEVRELRRGGKRVKKVDTSRDNSIADDMVNGEVTTTRNHGVNEEVRELRRSRRGKLLEVCEFESKRGKRDKEVDTSRDNSITDDMVNGEVREVRRSRSGKLSEVKEVDNKGGKKAKQLNVLEDNSIVDDGEVREVRRSRKGKLSEGSEVEIQGENTVTKVDDLDQNGIADDVLNGKVREVRRSRRGKVTEGSDPLKGNLPSAADNVPSLNLPNEEHIVVKKRFLNKRGVVDEEKRETVVVKKGSRKGTSVRNLRSGKVEDHEDVAGNKEAVTESACVHHELEVRRSNRHEAKVDYVQLVNENARKMVVVKEGSPVEANLRRSQRNASKSECPISIQDSEVITIANSKKETTRRRRDAVLEGEAARIDEGNHNERSFRQIKGNTKGIQRVIPTGKREKVAQKERGRSKKTNIEFNSSTEDIPTAAVDHDAQASSSEAAENNVCNNCCNDELIANVPDFESTSPTESNFSIEGQDFGTASGTFFDRAHSPLTENAVQKQGETSPHVERNEGNDSKTTLYIRTPLVEENDCLGLQNDCMDSALECANVELDKQHGVMADNVLSAGHSVSPCKFIKEKAKFESFDRKEREQLNLEEHNSREPENPLTLINVCEVATSYIDNDCASEAIHTTSIKAEKSKPVESSGTMHSVKTSRQREESTPMQMDGCGPHYLSAAVTNFEHTDLSSFKDSKSDENGNSKIECDNSEELLEHKSSDDAFRKTATRIQLDGDDNSGEDVIFPSDMQGEVLVSTPASAKAVEAATEFSGSIYDSKRVESPKPTFTLEVDDSDMLTQLSSGQKRGADAELYQDEHLGESSKHEEVGQPKPLNEGLYHSLESPELNFSTREDKDGPDNGNSFSASDGRDHSLHSQELNSSARTKFSIIQDQDLPDGGDSIAASDAQGVVLCLATEDTQIVVAGKGTDIELSSTTGANTESNHFLLIDDDMPNQGYGDCSEAKITEESVSVETLFMMKTPSTGGTIEKSVAEIENCTMSIDKSLKWVADTLEDQPELMMEGLGQGIYDCEAATNMEMHEPYVGREDEPVKVEKRNSNELKSPHHGIAATEDKHSELRMLLSKQRNGVDGDFLAEIHKHSEEGQILQEGAESEEAGHLMDQHNGFDDCLLHDKLNSSVISKLSVIQDQGISDSETVEIAESFGAISSPPNVATQIIGGRCTEIELGARKSSSMSSTVGIGSKHCLSTDDNAQNQGHEACFEEEDKEEADSVRALSIIQTPPTSKDDGSEKSGILMDRRSYGVIEVVNDELGSESKGMEPKVNCLSDCKAAIESETQESGNGKEGEPFNQETSSTIEAVHSAIEVETTGTVDGCPSNAAYAGLKNSNENGQVETSEVSYTKPVNISNPMVVTSNQENEMEMVMMSISMGREADSCQFDEKSIREEQEKEVSGHEDCVDAEEGEKQSMTQQNIFTNAFDETNAADRDGSVLKESDGALLQLDGQKADDFKFQREIDLKEEASKDNELAESGAEVHMLSSEIKIPPAESKGDDSFPFDHTKDAEKETGTSLAMLFETRVNMSRMNTEEMMVTDSNSQDPAASESSISKDQLTVKESEVSDTMIDHVDSESVETMSPSTKNPSSTLESYLFSGVAELVQLVEPEAGSVKELVGAAGKDNPPLNKQLDQGKATDLVQTETKSISGTADHQCAANADGVAAVEHNLVSNLKTDFTGSKNMGAKAGESISSAVKYNAKRKNARTILIHGTPNKLQMATHMKENAPSSKLEKVGALTSVRPVAKRTALKHLPWK